MSEKDIILTVIREGKDEKADHTYSKCYFKGKFVCDGIEDEFRKVKVHGETRIPDGIYELKTRVSPKFSKKFKVDSEFNLYDPTKRPELKDHELIWVTNVPNFNFILHHWGNTDDHTDGCYIVGYGRGKVGCQPAVLDSQDTYKAYYKLVMPEIVKGGKYIEYKTV